MKFNRQCSSCHAQFSVPPTKLADEQAFCPQCGNTATVVTSHPDEAVTPIRAGNRFRRRGMPGWGLALGIASLIACALPQLGLVLAIMGLVLSAQALRRRYAGFAIAASVMCSLGIVVNTIVCIQALLVHVNPLSLAETSSEGIVSTLKDSSFGLRKSELTLSAATVYGHWVEEDLLSDDSAAWSGSAGVYSERDGRLYLVTNRHCLGLEGLISSDDATDRHPDIKEYGMTVVFPSGVELPVLGFGILKDDIDIAFLAVDASKVRMGKDYVMLPFDRTATFEEGDEVVAVGSPDGVWTGTQTFGRISALRSRQAENQSYRIIQTDAAINHGNSGGPLFLRRDDRYVCIGINTYRVDGADNLGFAIDASVILNSDCFYWSDATAEALRKWIDQ